MEEHLWGWQIPDLTIAEKGSTPATGNWICAAYASRFFPKAYNLAKSGQLLIKTFPLPNFKCFLQNMEAQELFNETAIKPHNKTGNNNMFSSQMFSEKLFCCSQKWLNQFSLLYLFWKESAEANFQHGKLQPNWLALLQVVEFNASENGLKLRSRRQAYLPAMLLA